MPTGDALSNLDLLVYVSTALNTGHAWGLADQTIILPTFVRDEEPEPLNEEQLFLRSIVRVLEHNYGDGKPFKALNIHSQLSREGYPATCDNDQCRGNRRGCAVRKVLDALVEHSSKGGYKALSSIPQRGPYGPQYIYNSSNPKERTE